MFKEKEYKCLMIHKKSGDKVCLSIIAKTKIGATIKALNFLDGRFFVKTIKRV